MKFPEDYTNKIISGDSMSVLKTLPDQSINCCITSPPYWGLRDYGVDGQIGLEKTPDEYVVHMADVFREVRRVLKDDGTLWLNLGDSYCGTGSKGEHTDPKYANGRNGQSVALNNKINGLKSKDLVGIPWMVAFALRSDGWYLRQDIIWHKPNPMPESVTDRCTKAHEYIFLLGKSAKYYYDADAIKEPSISKSEGIRFGGNKYGDDNDPKYNTKSGNVSKEYSVANRRSVWTVTTKPFGEAHFATFPPALIEPMVLAGCPEGGIILDPFMGAGTTAVVAKQNNRNYLGIELNPKYVEMANKRIANVIVSKKLDFK